MDPDRQPKTFQRGSAAREIYGVLRDEIITLTLEPGHPLDETSLSNRFAVSRSPIREALNRLQAERLVDMLPNRSTIVAPVNLQQFPQFIQALDVQQRLATRLAAQHRRDGDLPRLRALAEDFNAAVAKGAMLGIHQANFAFHTAIGEVGANPWVARQYRELLSEARRLLHIHVRFLDTANRIDVMRNQHHDFVDAIAARNVAAADAIAHAHTMQFHDRFLKALRFQPDPGFDLGLSAKPAGAAP